MGYLLGSAFRLLASRGRSCPHTDNFEQADGRLKLVSEPSKGTSSKEDICQ